MIESFTSAFLVGLLGAGHCISMCGGITAALAFASPRADRRLAIIFTYNCGRIFSYLCVGAVFGLLGSTLTQQNMLDLSPILRSIAGMMLILMSFYLTQIYMGLTYLEKLGGYVWRFLQPYGEKFFPVTSVYQALPLGIIWGWLPCGLVYSMLALATTQANSLNGALVMLAFGLGTLPAVFIGGLAGERIKAIIANRRFRQIAALMLFIFGCWTIVGAWQHSHHSEHAHHHH